MHVTKLTSLLVLSLGLGTFGAPVPTTSGATTPPPGEPGTMTRHSFFEPPGQQQGAENAPLSPKTKILATIDPGTPGGTKNPKPKKLAATYGPEATLHQPIPQYPIPGILVKDSGDPRSCPPASTPRSASAHTYISVGSPELEQSSLPLTSAPKVHPSSTSTQFEGSPMVLHSSPLHTPLPRSESRHSSTSTQFEDGSLAASPPPFIPPKSHPSSTGTQFKGGPEASRFSLLHTPPPRFESSRSRTSTEFEEGISMASLSSLLRTPPPQSRPSSAGTEFGEGSPESKPQFSNLRALP